VPLILASRSPQRRAILQRLGIDFEVVDVDVEERADGPAAEVARENALRKARAG
jgi:septum formation protein